MSNSFIKHNNRIRNWRSYDSQILVATRTGPLDSLRNQNVLVIADAQNLMLGARDLGFRLSWKQLGVILDAAGLQVQKHVVYAARSLNERWASYFAQRGWIPHQRMTRLVRTRFGLQRRANTDHHIALISGALLIRSKARVIVVASGDGDLVEDIVEASRMASLTRRFVTLSLAGSTNLRLNAAVSSFISANIEIGRDSLRRAFAAGSSAQEEGAI